LIREEGYDLVIDIEKLFAKCKAGSR